MSPGCALARPKRQNAPAGEHGGVGAKIAKLRYHGIVPLNPDGCQPARLKIAPLGSQVNAGNEVYAKDEADALEAELKPLVGGPKPALPESAECKWEMAQ